VQRRFLSIVLLELLAASVLVAGVTLVRAFHFELALVSAALVYLSAASNVLAGSKRPAAGTALFVLVPLVPALAEQYLRQPCDPGSGFLFYFLYTVPAAVCGAGAGLSAVRLLKGLWLRASLVLAVVLLPAAYTLWTLYHDAPVRFFHLVFGMWPGSLYDEQVAITPALWVARFEGLVLGLSLVLLASDRLRKAGLAFGGLLLVLIAAEPLTGVRQPLSLLRERMGPPVVAVGVRFYPDPDLPAEVRGEIAGIIGEAVTHVKTRLGEDHAGRIELFLFRDVERRYEVTGARYTTFTKPWQGTAFLEPESLRSARGKSLLRHELTHLVTAPWGPLLGLPWNISLLEGTAVAVAPGSAERLAALAKVVLEKKPDLGLETFLRSFGFWNESAAVAYPLGGAFVQFVLEAKGPDYLKALWRLGPFEEPPEGGWKALAAGFRGYLEKIEPSEGEKATGTILSKRKSIFEKRCPHDAVVETGTP